MRHDRAELQAILRDASQSTVVMECDDLAAARSLRYALARCRGPAGRIIIRLSGRRVTAEPTRNGIRAVTNT